MINISKEMATELHEIKIIPLLQTTSRRLSQTLVKSQKNNASANSDKPLPLMAKCTNTNAAQIKIHVENPSAVSEQVQQSEVKQKRQPKIQPEGKVGFNMKILSLKTSSSSLKENKKVEIPRFFVKKDVEEDELSDDFEKPTFNNEPRAVCNKSEEIQNAKSDEDIDEKQRADWDIQGIDEEMCAVLKETLPLDFSHHIVAVQPFSNEPHMEEDQLEESKLQPIHRNKRETLPNFSAALRLDIRNKEEALDWLEHYQAASFTDWRVAKTFKENTPLIVFKKQLKCHHDTGASNPTSKTKKPHKKHTSCRARIIITVKNAQMKRSTDKLLGSHPCEIRIRHWHNHRLRAVKSLKFRRPSPHVANAFFEMFQRGHSPSSALLTHKFDLKVKHGENFYQAEADGAECPSIKWCYYQYYKAFKREYGANYGPEMIEKLKSLIDDYNKSCGKICAKMYQEENDLLVVLCSPLMQRVHEFLRASGEIVFMDFSGGMDRYNSRVGCLGTPSVAGGLPLGLMISSSETESMVTRGLQMLHDVYPEGKAFYGADKQGPKIFMTDDSTAERNSLKNIYPLAILLLCIFHLHQAFLRYVTDSVHQVKRQDRCSTIDMMKRLVYAKTEEDLRKKHQDMMENDVVKNNKVLSKHVNEDIFPRAKEWALCFRQGLMTKGNNTTNYMEVMLLQLKEIIFLRVKAFNTVQLFDFLTTRLDGYIESRIASVLNERNPNISLKYRPVSNDKLENLEATQISETIFRVRNKKSGGDYVVDMGFSICNCFKRNTGAQCKHQYLVAQKFNIPTQQFYEFMDMHQKLALHKIMTGNVNEPAGWYADLQDLVVHSPSAEHGDQISSAADGTQIVTNETSVHQGSDFNNCHEKEGVNVADDGNIDRQMVAVAECKERLDNVFKRLNLALDTKPDESLKALQQFCSTVEAQKTDSGLFSSLFQMKNVRRKGKYIKVSTESVRRRKTHLGGRKCQQTGRPPKAAFATEHAFSQSNVRAGPMDPAPTKGKAKVPHSFSERVNALRFSSEPPAKRAKK